MKNALSPIRREIVLDTPGLGASRTTLPQVNRLKLRLRSSHSPKLRQSRPSQADPDIHLTYWTRSQLQYPWQRHAWNTNAPDLP